MEPLELNNIFEIKNPLGGLFSRLDTSEEKKSIKYSN